jgi:hypothetical protein
VGGRWKSRGGPVAVEKGNEDNNYERGRERGSDNP